MVSTTTPAATCSGVAGEVRMYSKLQGLVPISQAHRCKERNLVALAVGVMVTMVACVRAFSAALDAKIFPKTKTLVYESSIYILSGLSLLSTGYVKYCPNRLTEIYLCYTVTALTICTHHQHVDATTTTTMRHGTQA
jgi:hypothetical protein